jgi:hypothetical protein
MRRNSSQGHYQPFQEFADFARVAKAEVCFGVGMIPHVDRQTVGKDGESGLIGSIVAYKNGQRARRKVSEKFLSCRTFAHNGAGKQLPDFLPLE